MPLFVLHPKSLHVSQHFFLPDWFERIARFLSPLNSYELLEKKRRLYNVTEKSTSSKLQIWINFKNFRLSMNYLKHFNLLILVIMYVPPLPPPLNVYKITERIFYAPLVVLA